jgi:hypothetical protein
LSKRLPAGPWGASRQSRRQDCLRAAHVKSGPLISSGLGSQRLGALRRPRDSFPVFWSRCFSPVAERSVATN